jgi:ribosome recycling factor
MAEKDIRDSINNANFNFQPKNKNDKNIVIWKFKVNNKETRDKWISQIKSSR